MVPSISQSTTRATPASSRAGFLIWPAWLDENPTCPSSRGSATASGTLGSSRASRVRRQRPGACTTPLSSRRTWSGPCASTKRCSAFPSPTFSRTATIPARTTFSSTSGHGNLLAFFDFPQLGLAPYAEVLGELHHIAISMTPQEWERAKDRLDEAGVPYQSESGTSIYFRDPDGARLELIADPLGEMYGTKVG